MSSPIHHAEDLDAALVYAPPWAREQGTQLNGEPPAPLGEMPTVIRKAEPDFSGDRAMSQLRRRLALDPDMVPEPPFEDARALGPMTLRLCAVTGIAALAAWGMVSLFGERKAESAPVPEPAPVVSANTVNRVMLVHVRAPAEAPALLQEGFAEPNAAQPQIETPPAPAPQPAAAPSDSATLSLDNDEIAMLVKRGKDLLTAGDLASARLLLRRAAEAGSAEAALALGATFDPQVIARLGAIGAAPDITQARKWYQKAAERGSQAAARQLEQLAQAHQ
jgi:hypothetical protein